MGGGSSNIGKGKPTTPVRAAAAAGGRGRGGGSVANGKGSSSSSSSSSSSNGHHARRGSRGSNRPTPDPSNSLQGTTERRRRGRVVGAGGAYPGQAGHKNKNNSNDVDLTNDDGSSSSSTPPSIRPSQAGQTADGGCPFCRASFVDPVLLVEHVEREHGEDGRREVGGGEGGGIGCQVA
ncbi:hypothetical protein VYU27_008283 [Nannochloropsis oceanica]